MSGWVDLGPIGKPLVLTVRVEGRVVGFHRLREGGDFLARIPLDTPLPPGTYTVDVEASASMNHAYGSFRTNRTVCGSSASTLSTCSSTGRFGLPLSVRNRSYVYLTSSAVSSRPFTGGLLCQRTPFRSLNTYVVSFGCVHDSARSASIGCVPGTTDGPAFTFTSRLMQ